MGYNNLNTVFFIIFLDNLSTELQNGENAEIIKYTCNRTQE